MNSKIINLLRLLDIEHNPSWRDEFENRKIKIKEKDNLAIFNYDVMADFSDPIVQEARGIIIDIKAMEVRCWPFRKFGNYGESYADNIDWNHCWVEEKIDGSIVKLYWDPDRYRWCWATNSCIDAADAPTSNGRKNYQTLIESAVNYNDIPFDGLNKNKTYIFELVSPETQVVIHYPYTKLFHTGTRDNRDGMESMSNLRIAKPKVYNLHTIDDCIKAAKELNKNSSNINHEGFVVVDWNWNRVKVKSPDYLMVHKIRGNCGGIRKEDAINLLKNTDKGITDVVYGTKFPKRDVVCLKYYDYKIHELDNNIEEFIEYTRSLYTEYGSDRKAVAMVIKNSKYAAYGFAAIENSMTVEEIINKIGLNKYCKMIPDYIREDVIP